MQINEHKKDLLIASPFAIKKGLFLFFFISNFLLIKSYCQDADSIALVHINKESFKLENKPFNLYDVATPNKHWTSLFRIPEHPIFDSLLTSKIEKQILAKINKRREEVAKDSLLTSDIFYIWKPYFDWLYYHDPHYIVDVMMMTNVKSSDYPLLFFSYININDTIVIDKSADPSFKKGDMILSINNVPTSDYLRYYYGFRYNNIFNMMKYHYFDLVSDTFTVELLRGNKNISIKTEGLKNKFTGWDYDIQNFPQSKSGYINIEGFSQNNKPLVKIVHNAIKKFKKKGYNNVILDLRKNPGGSGDEFDNLMSIFINKPIIQYQKGARLKVSKKTLSDYDFLTDDMIGKLVNLPEDELIREFATIPKMYIEGINYYVLVSENTGSTAVTFANILQYNNAAKLVGVPLLHNALKCGEVIKGGYIQSGDFTPTLLYSTGISTIEYDEYTKAIDGVIMPDMHIPYVAKDYLSGKDAMLEKLLDILKNK